MLALKFLRSGGVGPFSNVRWPLPPSSGPGEWLIAEARGPACVRGVHACDADHVAYWLAPELYVIELGGEIARSAKKLIADRGRLVRRVDRWDRDKGYAWAEACIGRARDITCEALRGAGEGGAADRLAACGDIASIGAFAAASAGGSTGGPGAVDQAALAMGYLSDAVRFVAVDPPASMFCCAHVGLTLEGFARERAWQSRWLAEDLELAGLGVGE